MGKVTGRDFKKFSAQLRYASKIGVEVGVVVADESLYRSGVVSRVDSLLRNVSVFNGLYPRQGVSELHFNAEPWAEPDWAVGSEQYSVYWSRALSYVRDSSSLRLSVAVPDWLHRSDVRMWDAANLLDYVVVMAYKDTFERTQFHYQLAAEAASAEVVLALNYVAVESATVLSPVHVQKLQALHHVLVVNDLDHLPVFAP